MESTTDSSTGTPPLQPPQPPQPQLPPGFRFHPTDEELVVHYLKKKAASAPLPVDIIAEVDLYKFDPWELPAKANFGEQEWYFFSPRDRKYPNGVRPNRAATSGYWKATGTDKPVFTAGGNQKVGVKKALVFYGGKPPKGVKTNWIMHEYRITENKANNKPPGCDIANKKGSLRLDDWVLCRIYKKNNTQRPIDHHERDDMNDMMGSIPNTCIATSISPFEQNIYEGIVNNNTSNIINNNNSNNNVGSISSSVLPPKQPLPAGLYWNNDHNASSPSAKRFLAENSFDDGLNMNITRPDEQNSFLSQLPQNDQLLGSLSDGVVFRQTYNQVTGMNWYS